MTEEEIPKYNVSLFTSIHLIRTQLFYSSPVDNNQTGRIYMYQTQSNTLNCC